MQVQESLPWEAASGQDDAKASKSPFAVVMNK